MDINGIQSSNALQVSTKELGDLLKDMTNANMALENKMQNINIAEKVSNTGSQLDVEA